MSAPCICILIVRAGGLLPAFVRDCAGRLSPDERAEFSRMSDPRQADVRTVLRAEANRWRATGAKVSVSHSGGFGVLAVSNSVEALGVDAESWAGEVPEPDLVGEVTSPEEFKAWVSLPPAAKRPAFIRLWTLKEATLKARGLGLSAGMRTISTLPDFSGLAEPGWRSALVEADAGHSVALVWRGASAEISVESLTRESSF